MTHPHLHPAPAAPRPGGAGRALLTAGVLVNAAVLVVGSTVAAFTGSASTTPQTSSSGTVSVTLSAVSGTVDVTSGITGLAAGDYFERLVDVSPGTGLAIGSWTLSTSANPSSVLDTTATNGLRLTVETCSKPWTDSVSSTDPAVVHTYTCTGTGAVAGTALAERDIIMTPQPLTGLSTGGANHLKLTVKLAAGAGDALQGKTSGIVYTFSGVQRAGQAR